ncbi:hypothetical protein BT69DRAFT_1346379 [Atractiella rhizophila]|nr:hypothetical protein BT69DRAFT_1346379 [Atractiella rhizophila]
MTGNQATQDTVTELQTVVTAPQKNNGMMVAAPSESSQNTIETQTEDGKKVLRIRGGGAGKDCFMGLVECFICFECCRCCCDCFADIICCPCEVCC